MCGEVQNAVLGEAAPLGEFFERGFGCAGPKQDFALGNTKSAADRTQLIGSLWQRRELPQLLDVGVCAAE